MLNRARTAQRAWAQTELLSRLRAVKKIRTELARSAQSILDCFPRSAGYGRAGQLASEVIPLAEAARFLEREAAGILAPRRMGSKGRSLWLRGVEIEERRDALGVVLIIGPGNYPLFLTGVQTLQALTAGNAVMVKPGRGGAPVMEAFREIALDAGVPADVFHVFDEDPASAESIIADGVDSIVLTGSAETGRAVFRNAAERLIPLTLELSGCDPVFVLEGADLPRAADAIAFGVGWNNGSSCITPRRVFAAASVAEIFARILQARCPEAAPPVRPFQNEEEALRDAEESPYALGATVFGPEQRACAFARKVRAGVVVVNDMIVPTADPRLSFGGRGESGFGKTRGAEGLRQFTVLKQVTLQKARRLRHLEPLPENAEELFSAYLSVSNACGWTARLKSASRLASALFATARKH